MATIKEKIINEVREDPFQNYKDIVEKTGSTLTNVRRVLSMNLSLNEQRKKVIEKIKNISKDKLEEAAAERKKLLDKDAKELLGFSISQVDREELQNRDDIPLKWKVIKVVVDNPFLTDDEIYEIVGFDRDKKNAINYIRSVLSTPPMDFSEKEIPKHTYSKRQLRKEYYKKLKNQLDF